MCETIGFYQFILPFTIRLSLLNIALSFYHLVVEKKKKNEILYAIKHCFIGAETKIKPLNKHVSRVAHSYFLLEAVVQCDDLLDTSASCDISWCH